MAKTVNEFKAWLQGMEEFSGKDWVPSKAQWKKIKKEIMQLEDNLTGATSLQTRPISYNGQVNPLFPNTPMQYPQQQTQPQFQQVEIPAASQLPAAVVKKKKNIVQSVNGNPVLIDGKPVEDFGSDYSSDFE